MPAAEAERRCPSCIGRCGMGRWQWLCLCVEDQGAGVPVEGQRRAAVQLCSCACFCHSFWLLVAFRMAAWLGLVAFCVAHEVAGLCLVCAKRSRKANGLSPLLMGCMLWGATGLRLHILTHIACANQLQELWFRTRLCCSRCTSRGERGEVMLLQCSVPVQTRGSSSSISRCIREGERLHPWQARRDILGTEY